MQRMAPWRRPGWLQEERQMTEGEALLKDPNSACHRSHCPCWANHLGHSSESERGTETQSIRIGLQFPTASG